MPDKRTHRGPHPEDRVLFSSKQEGKIRCAVADFSMLLTKGYGVKGALKLVGDKFDLTARQRLAVQRGSCSDEQLALRTRHRTAPAVIAGEAVAIDGYNVLITVEAAMSSGVIFIGRDGAYRDLASIHGTYRKVSETIPAIEVIGAFLSRAGVKESRWLLDSPVSNSGRVKTLIGEIAEKNGWRCNVALALNPDAELIKSSAIVASSDSVILDGCGRWVNLAGEIIEKHIPSAKVIDLRSS